MLLSRSTVPTLCTRKLPAVSSEPHPNGYETPSEHHRVSKTVILQWTVWKSLNSYIHSSGRQPQINLLFYSCLSSSLSLAPLTCLAVCLTCLIWQEVSISQKHQDLNQNIQLKYLLHGGLYSWPLLGAFYSSLLETFATKYTYQLEMILFNCTNIKWTKLIYCNGCVGILFLGGHGSGGMIIAASAIICSFIWLYKHATNI